MAMHAKSGGNLEIMGMLYGKVQDDAFIVVDAFALPVEGTETRVNAQAEAYEYMVDFNESTKVRAGHLYRHSRRALHAIEYTIHHAIMYLLHRVLWYHVTTFE